MVHGNVQLVNTGHEYEDLSLVPWTQFSKLGMGMLVCNPSAGQAKRLGSWAYWQVVYLLWC